MTTLNEEQQKWKLSNHAFVNPQNFTERKKVIDAFVKNFTIDERLPQYVNKTFLTKYLDTFNVKYHINEHKILLWEKIKKHLAGEVQTTNKKISKKKVVAEPKAKQETSAATPNLSCTQVLSRLLSKYEKKTLPSKKTLEKEARILLHAAEPELAKAVSFHALASLQAHANSTKKKMEPVLIETETETEEDEGTTTEEEDGGITAEEEKNDGTATEEEKEENSGSGEDEPNFAHLLTTLQASRLSKSELTKRLNTLVSNYDFLEVYDVIAANAFSVQHITKYSALYGVVVKYARNVLHRASSEFPEGRERDDFAIEEFLEIFHVFQFSHEEATKFIQDVVPQFPPTLKKIILRRLEKRE